MRIYIVITFSITLFYFNVKGNERRKTKLNYLLQKPSLVFVQIF